MPDPQQLTRREREVNARLARIGSELLRCINHGLQRFGFVILEENGDRQQAAHRVSLVIAAVAAAGQQACYRNAGEKG